MKRREFLSRSLAGAAALPVAGSLGLAATGAARPNIIVILVDDMGYSDLACYGSEIETPNLDRLAAGGLRFSNFYNTGRCCPTRASLLTGLYPHQAGVGHMTADLGTPAYQGYLNDRCVTLAEVLSGAGYFTAQSGKWHVGFEKGATPASRGFHRSLCAPAGGFYYPGRRAKLALNGRVLEEGDAALPKDWYSTDLWTDFGIRFIEEGLAEKKPFFLYLAHNAPHFPIQAPAADIAKYRGRYKAKGWDRLREARWRRQVELGLVDGAWPLSPRPEEVKAWDSLTEAEQDRFDQIMSVYAAAVDHIDQSVGRLTEALAKRGALDNTLILFLSDNGGNAESGPRGRAEGKAPGDAGSTVYCGQSWATLENTPFRRYKHHNHEGGIATPLIAHWPVGLGARGALTREPGHLVDLMATCVDLAGAAYPTEFQGKPILPMEGKSLVPAFQGRPIPRNALYWEHEGNAALLSLAAWRRATAGTADPYAGATSPLNCSGDWKLVRLGREGNWELYDATRDRTELRDLASNHPELVKLLSTRWETWAKRAGVIPYPEKKIRARGKKKIEPGAEKPDD